MFKNLKFFLQKLFSSKYVISGKCNKCGDCCRQITFSVADKLVTDEQEFLRMQNFEKKYKNFEINGKTEDGVLLFKCKALKDDGSCGVHWFRSVNCRLYPRFNKMFVHDGGEPLDRCGYKFSVDKKFSEYLDKKP
ncbi:MAG: YkgJ family cysteine cluster protein [Candidatus Gastranaerophilales bacterium]|nr:YkgJ family cysteine cluster protein [Candidatus Gastranaerophilales bacterium]